MLTLILLLVFFGCVAMLVREGIWSNVITLFNVLLAGLLALNYFEPLADWIELSEPTYTYVWDFLSIWAVFCASMIVLRGISDKLSLVRVRFKGPVDLAGGAVLALWVGWLMTGFVLLSFHTAPIPTSFLGFYEDPAAKSLFGFAPDRQWLGLAQKASLGSLGTSPPDGVAEKFRDPEHAELNVFDPRGEFIFRYHERRVIFAKQLEIRVQRN